MKGKLIVIEGTDGSGKATQTELLYNRLQEEGHPLTKLSFPRYGKPSARLVELYLSGAFGDSPTDIDPYEASKYYAVDRYASFKEDWEDNYNQGNIVLSDRYTTSNIVHQSAKMLKPDRIKFFKWIADFEYNKLAIPEPDIVIYLDMPLDITSRLMRGREVNTNTKADIHEKDIKYLAQCKDVALDAARYFKWNVISCVHPSGDLKTIEEIHEEVYKKLRENIELD